jgi:hypothetical protein
MGGTHDDDQYGDEEAERRMNEALRRALNTPPQPRTTGRRKGRKSGEDRPAPKRDDGTGA